MKRSIHTRSTGAGVVGVAAAAACLFASLTACPPTQTQTPDSGVPADFCEVRSDCVEPGKVCTAENYCADCQTSGQCRLKEECHADTDAGTQRCALRAGWGTVCERNDQCQAGQWCVQGLCKDSTEVRLCPNGTAEECLTGQRCNAVNLVCEEDLGCAENADCSPGEVCNVGSHSCVPRCTPQTQAQVCGPSEKCVDEKCVQCATDAECGVGLFCDAAGQCVASGKCYQDRDCKVPLVCYIPTGQCVTRPPPCVSDENCAPDQKCNVGTGKCIPRNCQPDVFEANDDRDSAKAVKTNTLHTGLTLCPNDLDYYAFTLSRGDQLGINIDADPFAESTFTTVVQDSTGRTLASGRLLTSYVAAAPDTYYVAISTSDAFQPYDVRFLLSRGTPCDDDGWEPNDLPTQAVPLNAAGVVDGVVCPQDKDHFTVTVPAGKGVQVSLTDYNSANGLLRLCLFDGATQLGCSEDVKSPLVAAPAETVAGKAVTARIDAADVRAANSYTLKVEFP